MKLILTFLLVLLAASAPAINPILRNSATTNAIPAAYPATPMRFPLALRTPTGLPNVVHPSVLSLGTNWNGYSWWMCFEPYPPGTSGIVGDPYQGGAEDICVLASNDGDNWVVPRGATNPVANRAEISLINYFPGAPRNGDSGGHLSDGELFLNTNGTMIVFYRANSGMGSTPSSTSLLIGTGSKSFTVAASLGWYAGLRIRAYSGAINGNWMEGVISSYSGTTLVIAMDTINGAGTLADWTLTCDDVYLVSKTSVNGYQWSALNLLKTNCGGPGIISPQVTQLGSGIVRLFAGNASLLETDIYSWDATDGNGTNFNWGAKTDTGIASYWHFDAKWKSGNELWIIASTAGGVDPYSQLRLYTSPDNGATFTLASSQVNPPSGARWDYWGYYKPDFFFNSDGTIELFTDSSQPIAGGVNVGTATNADFSYSMSPFYVTDAQRIGRFSHLTVQTNTPTTNFVVAPYSMPVLVQVNPGETNATAYIPADTWIDKFETRHGRFYDWLTTPEIRLWQYGIIPNSLQLSGYGSGNYARFRIDGTNQTGNKTIEFMMGGDGTGGITYGPTGFGMGFYLSPLYPDVYIKVGNSTADTSGGIIWGRDYNGGLFNRFLINATTLSWVGSALGNGAGITNTIRGQLNGFNLSPGFSTTVNYYAFDGGPSGVTSTTEAIAATSVTACALTNLYVKTFGVVAGTNVVFTIMTNGVASGMTANVTGTGATAIKASDTTHIVNLAANDTLSMKIVGNNASASAANITVTWSVETLR